MGENIFFKELNEIVSWASSDVILWKALLLTMISFLVGLLGGFVGLVVF